MAYHEELHPLLGKAVEHIDKVMIGKRDIAILSLAAILAKGHVLLEDVPGVGKTMMVRSLAKSIGADFKRIQFTPDLLPSDVTGVSIYNSKTMEFEYRPGPIMGHIVLADEINRTSPKTQSALLEAMEEGSVTVDGKTMPLAEPFLVMATQNPVEYEGTYPLPEAQLDRFLFKLRMGYPSVEEELEVLALQEKSHPIETMEPVITKEQFVRLQREVQHVQVDASIKAYIVDLTHKTRQHPSVYLGVSPRGSIALMKAAQAYALMHNRDYVIPDDIQYLAPYSLPHRMILHSEAKFEGMQSEVVIREIISNAKVPVQRSLSR
ncbi:MoxR family ATPase [Bacillus atrophaeus]|uniref:AAA family ATPase n=1 Tax=Bacillus atrophaeus TaxID=1452 RepID=UPI000D03666E|nr:MoxR family ATPase [Bacillus atrophaeus]MCY8486997.1 MoxR family ATPase [Bacillus atrophaeus]MCY8506437.1 MoxR family ATPase [Bacillus atrophaeus]MCY8950850.1 MoxR family ATPase [Bacillus atrophaeus]MCY8967736.1 MoxR family ATPase [Bacillus atrophaeus]MCY8973529.1 MoxR family ATPase [Bacillus atrophaeus]